MAQLGRFVGFAGIFHPSERVLSPISMQRHAVSEKVTDADYRYRGTGVYKK